MLFNMNEAYELYNGNNAADGLTMICLLEARASFTTDLDLFMTTSASWYNLQQKRRNAERSKRSDGHRPSGPNIISVQTGFAWHRSSYRKHLSTHTGLDIKKC